MIANRNKRLSQESFSDGTCQKRSREHEDTNSNGFQGISNSAAVTGSESMKTDSHHMHDFLTEVVVDVNLSGEKNKASLDKAIITAVALRNSCGGVIRWNYEKTTSEKQIDNWITSYCSKESDLGEVDPNFRSCFHYVKDATYIFVRKTSNVLTQVPNLFKRLEKSNEKIKGFSQIESMLKRHSKKQCSCINQTLETGPFHQNNVVSFFESQYTEFKNFPDCDFTPSGISQKVKENVGAFANTDGGTLYIGIADNRKVIGQLVAKDDECQIKESIGKQIKEMIWLPYYAKTGITPEVERHYRISFAPVGGTTDRVVIVLHICRFDGTVFLDKPKCSTIDDSDQVVNMEFEEWLMHFQTPETNDPRYERKNCVRSVYKPLKGTILDKTFQDLPGQIRVHPKHAVEWIVNDTFTSLLDGLNESLGANGGHAFVQKRWDTMLGKPCNKPSNVICDILLCLPDYPLILITLINSEKKTSEVHQYNVLLATMTKRELAQEARCLEEFFVKPLVLRSRDISSFSELKKEFSRNECYPHQYSNMSPDKYCKLLGALALVLAKVNYCVTCEAQQKHYLVLTQDQYDILDEFYGSASSVQITGPPGTGKTLLAIERISRLRMDGCRFEEILFLCSNKILAARVRNYQMRHDKKRLCRVWNYYQCIESVKFGEVFNLGIRHIVADEIHNFKENPSENTPYRWWEQLLKICDDEESTCWFFYDFSQRITKEETVKIPRRFPTKNLETVIRTTRETYNFYKRFMPNRTGIGLGHDIEGPKPRILIPQQSGVRKERNLENILLYVLHDLIVTKGHSPSSISVLFADDTEREKYSELFQKRALRCKVRDGEKVNKRGIIFDTIRRYSGDDNGIVIGFCPKFFLSPRFQDNKALMLSLCSRPQWELILVFDSTRTANSFGIQTQECTEIQPENKQIWDFSSH